MKKIIVLIVISCVSTSGFAYRHRGASVDLMGKYQSYMAYLQQLQQQQEQAKIDQLKQMQELQQQQQQQQSPQQQQAAAWDANDYDVYRGYEHNKMAAKYEAYKELELKDPSIIKTRKQDAQSNARYLAQKNNINRRADLTRTNIKTQTDLELYSRQAADTLANDGYNKCVKDMDRRVGLGYSNYSISSECDRMFPEIAQKVEEARIYNMNSASDVYDNTIATYGYDPADYANQI